MVRIWILISRKDGGGPGTCMNVRKTVEWDGPSKGPHGGVLEDY